MGWFDRLLGRKKQVQPPTASSAGQTRRELARLLVSAEVKTPWLWNVKPIPESVPSVVEPDTLGGPRGITKRKRMSKEQEMEMLLKNAPVPPNRHLRPSQFERFASMNLDRMAEERAQAEERARADEDAAIAERNAGIADDMLADDEGEDDGPSGPDDNGDDNGDGGWGDDGGEE